MRRPALLWIIALLLIGALASCSETSAPDVLTTTTILADVARNVAGERLAVGSLLPLGTDPHSYQPSPQDTARISNSQVLIVNGAGYEHFLEALLENAGGERALIEASAGLRLGDDPHFWLDPNLVITYVENIRAGLTDFDPEGAEVYRSNAGAYSTQLEELDAWIDEQVAQIPAERRLLVTNHEAFTYFAERYGFTVVGTLIERFSSDASPSAQQMAALIDQIREYDVRAIFLDASDNPALAQQVAAETGVRVVTDLQLESLTEGPPAATYIDMMKYNVTQIVQALK